MIYKAMTVQKNIVYKNQENQKLSDAVLIEIIHGVKEIVMELISKNKISNNKS
ncbi:hypothetical protein [Proteiniclasticum sp. QWL-01]|uniref:hypothetical protein n=1 Tax=Proteiniclasticum sp. QWL-01 TaxID=3036945 RepID=UPI002410646C|nr:hypothetical protein [Proteiniclasticum sp. QWL-01]WFF71817.1 hypothetical protein P6M73_10925 [Proteiniclasticum sp. QWL-01]